MGKKHPPIQRKLEPIDAIIGIEIAVAGIILALIVSLGIVAILGNTLRIDLIESAKAFNMGITICVAMILAGAVGGIITIIGMVLGGKPIHSRILKF